MSVLGLDATTLTTVTLNGRKFHLGEHDPDIRITPQKHKQY